MYVLHSFLIFIQLNKLLKFKLLACIFMENSVDPDQMASSEVSWSGSTVFSNMDKSGLSS